VRIDAIKTITGLIGLLLAGGIMIYANTIPPDRMVTVGCFAIWFIAWAFSPLEINLWGEDQ
jgi:hypothetical protein